MTQPSTETNTQAKVDFLREFLSDQSEFLDWVWNGQRIRVFRFMFDKPLWQDGSPPGTFDHLNHDSDVLIAEAHPDTDVPYVSGKELISYTIPVPFEEGIKRIAEWTGALSVDDMKRSIEAQAYDGTILDVT